MITYQQWQEQHAANQLRLNPAGDAYDLCTEFRARRDERAYKMLEDAGRYVELLQAAGHISQAVLKAVQIDVLVGHLAIDVARQTEAI